MASYLRPRRGSYNNAKTQLTASNPLKSGEVFFECENIGKSQGKIKLGDATTTYSSLPYFLSMQDSSIGFTDVTGSNSTAESTILGNIKPSGTHSSVIQNIKQLLWNHSSKITALDSNKVPTSRTINSKALSSNISLTASDVGASASNHNHAFSSITSKPTTISGYGITDAYTKTEIDNIGELEATSFGVGSYIVRIGKLRIVSGFGNTNISGVVATFPNDIPSVVSTWKGVATLVNTDGTTCSGATVSIDTSGNIICISGYGVVANQPISYMMIYLM